MTTDSSDTQPANLDPQAVLEQLKRVAADELELPRDQVERIGLETPLVGGLQLDSLAQTVLLAEIEERYGFSFGPLDREELQNTETVADLVRIIQARARPESE